MKNNPIRRLSHTLLAVCLSLGLSACVQTTSRWDTQFGDAARLAAARQTLNPAAGQKEVAESVDGNTSREAVGRYRNSFKEPPQNSNSFVIGVGR